MRWCDLIASRLIPIRVRAHLYRLVGIPIGQGTGIQSDVFIDGPALRIGSGCFINRFCKFDAVGADVTVGDNVFMGFNVLVITSTHEHGTHDLRASHTTHARHHRSGLVDRRQHDDPAGRDHRRRLRHRSRLGGHGRHEARHALRGCAGDAEAQSALIPTRADRRDG